MTAQHIKSINHMENRLPCACETGVCVHIVCEFKSNRIDCAQATMTEFGLSSVSVAWWRRHLMLLESLDALGTFLKQPTLYGIEFPYQVKGKRGVKQDQRNQEGGARRKNKSGQTLLKSFMQQWNLFLYFSFFSLLMQTCRNKKKKKKKRILFFR